MRYCSRCCCRCCCCPLAFYKNIMFYHPSRILVYGMALCRLWFATCYFYLAIFVYIFLHLQICNCNCPVYVFVELEMQHHGSRQQCHHSKLTKSQQSHSLCIFLCLKKETCTTWRMSFHVKLSTGMSENCTCFNDFLHFCLAFVEPFCSFGCQKFNCTNALFHLMNKGNICPRLMHIIFTCQVEPSTCWIVFGAVRGFWVADT